MKTFKIEATEANTTWVNKNLDARDFTIESNEIVITYFNEMQKTDILNAIEEKNATIATYDVRFNDNNDSNSKEFKMTLEEAKSYIKTNNGTNNSYFANYKGGSVSIVCNENEEVVYEEEVK